uniref:ATP synthase F0 subunit 8 n=1 Tax=Chorisoserrata biceps TaxID=3037039 RepID=UPI0027A81D00|nr:ATP synthase F0 subunit 8 [Chorisoserrata biceps]WGO57187.1 ATP synthase F0 subunit 8 [Chorisoserrata biceps]
MPQMMPMNWLLLFLFFLMIFIMFNIIIYFNKMMNPNLNNIFLKHKSLKWKW